MVRGQSPVNNRRVGGKHNSKAGRLWSWGVDAQEFPGGIPEAKHVLAFCQATFCMTLSWMGFLTLAPDKKCQPGPLEQVPVTVIAQGSLMEPGAYLQL